MDHLTGVQLGSRSIYIEQKGTMKEEIDESFVWFIKLTCHCSRHVHIGQSTWQGISPSLFVRPCS